MLKNGQVVKGKILSPFLSWSNVIIMFAISDMNVAAVLTKVDLLDPDIKKDIKQADRHRAVQEVICTE